MGFVGVSLRLLVACSLLLGRCWAGPINIRSNTVASLKKPESVVSHDALCDPGLDTRDSISKGSNSFVLLPRSITPGTSNSSSMWVVTAVVGIILLLCLLIVGAVIIRRSKKRQKTASDEELGFGKHPKVQSDLVPPPKAYDGTSRSPPGQIETSEMSGNTRKPPPPPLVTVSSPEEPGPKLKRIPAPLPSPRLIGLPPSPRLGLPPSPRSTGLPPSPRLLSSPRVQWSNSGTHLSEPQQDHDRPSSPRGLPSSSSDASFANDGRTFEVPLSAGGLERMITTIELELKQHT